MTDLALERFTSADLAGLLAVTASSGWLHTADDWGAVLHAGTVVGHRRADGEIVSTAALFSYGSTVATIGMVVVKPDCRGRGLARALMLHCLELRPAGAPAVLIATPFGLPLYVQLGFKTVAHIRRLTSTGSSREPSGPQRELPPAPRGLDVVPLRDDDLAAITELDARAFGAVRRRMLEARLRYARRASALRDTAGALRGFAIAVPQRHLIAIGPIIAPDADSACALIADVATGHRGDIVTDVPSSQTELVARLEAAGFSAGAEAPVMIYDGDELPGDRARLFAIPNRGFC